MNSIAIAAHTAQPCRCDPVILPSVYVRAEPMAKIAEHSESDWKVQWDFQMDERYWH